MKVRKQGSKGPREKCARKVERKLAKNRQKNSNELGKKVHKKSSKYLGEADCNKQRETRLESMRKQKQGTLQKCGPKR